MIPLMMQDGRTFETAAYLTNYDDSKYLYGAAPTH